MSRSARPGSTAEPAGGDFLAGEGKGWEEGAQGGGVVDRARCQAEECSLLAPEQPMGCSAAC